MFQGQSPGHVRRGGQPPKVSSRMRISQTSSNPSCAEDRARHRRGLRDERRRAARDRVVPPRRDERPVGASAARLGQRRAAEERHAVLRERPRARAPPARRRRRPGTRCCSDRARAASPRSAPARRRRSPRSVRRRARSSSVSTRRTSTSGGAAAGGSLSTMPTASGIESSTSPSASRRSTRSSGVACRPDLPGARRAPLRPQPLVDLARAPPRPRRRPAGSAARRSSSARRHAPSRARSGRRRRARPSGRAACTCWRSPPAPASPVVITAAPAPSPTLGGRRPSGAPPSSTYSRVSANWISWPFASPAVDIPLPGVVRSEHEPFTVVLLEQVVEVPGAVADVDLRRRRDHACGTRCRPCEPRCRARSRA